MGYKVGAGSACQVALQSAEGTTVVPDTLLNMTQEGISVSVEKGDEGNLLLSKTANQRDLLSIKVEGSVSTILRPEFADWLFEASMGIKTGSEYTLQTPNQELPISTFVMSRGGIVKTYPDVTVKSVKVSAAAQDYVKADIDIAGIKELSAGDEGAQNIQNLSFSKPSYRCTQATLYWAQGGTAKESVSSVFDVESCDITIDNGCEDAPSVYSSGVYSQRPMMGRRSVSVDFSIPYSDAVDSFKRSYYTSEDSPSVALKLRFTTSDAEEYVEVYIPYLNITSADGNVGGEGIIDCSFSGEALSVGNAEPIVVTVHHREETQAEQQPGETEGNQESNP